jgi:hypothetical protein
MHFGKLRNWILLVVTMTMVSLLSCKAEKVNPPEKIRGGDDAEEQNKSPEDQCFDSGGSFDVNSNECRCPSERTLQGFKCLLPGEEVVDEVTKKDCEDTGGIFQDQDSSCECPAPKDVRQGRCVDSSRTEAEDCVGAGGDWDRDDSTCECPAEKNWNGQKCESGQESSLWKDVEKSCKDAGGKYADNYCKCSAKKVFNGDSCIEMSAGITRTICEDTVSPGEFTSKCGCSSSRDIFSPARGGCMPKVEFDKDVQKDICISSLNGGVWKDDENRCVCPSNKIWHNEICYAPELVSPVDVCEADYNGGKWEGADNTCRCRNGFSWFKNACVLISNLDEQAACKAPFNGGSWDAAGTTCLCPDNKGWVKSLKTCAAGAPTPSQLLCTQSGGVPGEVAGKCSCGNGLIIKIKAPQNYEYCAKDDDDELPLWLIILLGL